MAAVSSIRGDFRFRSKRILLPSDGRFIEVNTEFFLAAISEGLRVDCCINFDDVLAFLDFFERLKLGFEPLFRPRLEFPFSLEAEKMTSYGLFTLTEKSRALLG